MKGMDNGSLLAAGVFALAGFSVTSFGADFYLKTGASDFSVPGGYTLDAEGTTPATSVPGADDEVIVPSGTFAIDVSSASFTTLSGVKRVRPSEGAVLEFTADESVEGTFAAPINWNGDAAVAVWNEVSHFGKIVKKGAGTLVLGSCGRTQCITPYGSYNQDYVTGIDLREGTLKLPQYAPGDMYFGDLTMADGTVLVTCGNLDDSSKATPTRLRSLGGYGIVTNESGRSAGQIFATYNRSIKIANEFHGRIYHPARIWLSGRITHYGDETGLKQPVVVEANYGDLNNGFGRGVYSFENVALFGSAANIQMYGMGGGFHYFGGEDAVVDKTVSLYTTVYPAFIDAGWHGGLTFTGGWNIGGDNLERAVQKWVVLTGSNTVPCVITGNFVDSRFSGAQMTDTLRTIFTQKLGSGTWRFSGTRTHGGGFAVEEGSLQFDSIAEKGVASALGRSTNLTTACSVRDPEHVDYAFSLGSTNAGVPAANFEFTGSRSCVSTTRPLVLNGHGGSIRASGTDGARLGFGGISALGEDETTLVLDGTNSQFNVAANITDGNGVVNVVKEGEGEWTLSGTNSFSGDLTVKEGTLNVLGSKYAWFRFTVRQTASGGNLICFRQLALYDADGIRQNICLKVNPPTVLSAGSSQYWPDTDWAGLQPGSFAFGTDEKAFRCAYYPDNYVDQLFSDVGNTVNAGIERFDGQTSYGKTYQMYTYDSVNGSKPLNIRKTDPSSWMPFVMRLTNGAPEIVAYDIQSYYHSAGSNHWPKVCSMEASVDGMVWDPVETNAMGEVVEEHEYDFSIPLGSADPGVNAGKPNRWYSDGTAQTNWSPETGTTPRPGKGFPMRSRADMPMPLQNVRSVSVAPGATLRTADSSIAIDSLKVDADGAGTIEGFAFAESGGLHVTFDGVPDHGTVALPGTYVSCSGIENIANWTLDVDFGEEPATRKYRVNVVDGRIVLSPIGLAISIR